MKAILGLSVSLGLLAFASAGDAAPKPKDEKDNPIKAFDGAWSFASWDQGGNSFPKEALDLMTWSVKGDKYKFSSGEQTEEGTIKFDPEKKPATIDFDITEGTDKGKTQVGIYKVEKGQITLCLARPGEKDRPKDFKATDEDGNILIVLKKKDD